MNPTGQGREFQQVLDKSDTRVAEFKVIRHTLLDRVQHVLHNNPTLVPVIVLLISLAAFGLIAGGRFFSAFNLSLILQQVSIIGMLAAAQSMTPEEQAEMITIQQREKVAS